MCNQLYCFSGFFSHTLEEQQNLQTGKTVQLVAQSPATLDVLDRYNLDNFFSDLGNSSDLGNISDPENISEHGNISSTNH